MNETNRRLQKYKDSLERQQQESFEQFVNFDYTENRKYKQHLIQESKLIEIRSFTATELFKARSKTNRLFEEFAQIKKMKSAIQEMDRNATLIDKTEFNTQSMTDKLERQFDSIRRQLAKVQERYELLKGLKQQLSMLAELCQFDDSPYAQIE